MNAPHSPHLSFADVSCDEAIARACALIPALRERAAEAEATRIMNPATIADLNRTGLLRFSQPKRWGGMELDFVSAVDIPAELAKGCASTAWNVANLAIHHWMLAMYDERAQDEVWSANPDALIASGIAYNQGRARKVDGGYVIEGHWNFSSGVNISSWNMLAVLVYDGDKAVDHRMCLVRENEYEIVDDWQVMGMKSTGSMSVRTKDVFVPEYRALCTNMKNGGANPPGLRVNPSPLYKVPFGPLAAHTVGGVVLGNALGALEQTVELVKSRSTVYTGARMRDFQAVQLRIADAASRIEAARLMLRNDCIEGQKIAASGRDHTMEEKLRPKRNLAFAVQLCTEAVDRLHSLAGANGIYDKYPIQRYFRDAHAAGAHFLFSWDAQAGPWALVELGGDYSAPTL
jgi:3-hydroxy-9,10-secoandrosta-1,3,5(10)-triene-9,17-dione monooxygenase